MKKKINIVLGVTGSIAAYKACELVRLCIKEQWNVNVIMTPSATQFVPELTFQTLSRNPVGIDMFEAPKEWRPEHVNLADSATVFVVAPCSANTMAKISLGLADNLLTSTALACKAPMILAPAMNAGMWTNVVTQEHVKALKKRGVIVMDTGTGDLACGYKGCGRMPEPEEIFEEIKKVVKKK